ncbi:MAG: tetratricopeptide repeat protein, partial [Bryobacterales bacterium]|nr:tetratricopeptide repeat protein [Bryobacterales bacterium]
LVHLAPGSVVNVAEQGLSGTAGGPCEFPLIDTEAPAGSVSESGAAAVEKPDDPFDQILSVTYAGAVAEREGKFEAALAAYRDIRDRWPSATWIHEPIDRLVRRQLPQPRVVRGGAATPRPASAQPAGATSRTYALVVGVSKYKTYNNLQFAAGDADAFAKYLTTERGGSLIDCRKTRDQPKPSDCQLQVLLDERARADAVRSELAELVRGRAGADNTLILYFSAHGAYMCRVSDSATLKVKVCEPGQGESDAYILTHESDPNEPATSAISLKELRGIITEQAEQFGRVLAFIDVCHAAITDFPRSTRPNPGQIDSAIQTKRGKIGVMSAITKADDIGEEYAYEVGNLGGGHGAFTFFLVRGMNGDVQPQDNQVFFSELFRFVQQKVEATLKEYKKLQSPSTGTTTAKIAVVDDASKPPGIDIGEVNPQTVQLALNTKRGKLRGLKIAPEDAGPGQDFDTFETALASGSVDRASTLLSGIAPGLTADALSDKRRRLRVAFEVQGQDVILAYLKGDQSPPSPGRFRDAERYFREALALAPDSAFDRSRMLFSRGRQRIFEGRYQDAILLLEQAAEIDPGRAYASNAVGIAYLEFSKGDKTLLDRGIRAFEDAARLAPYWPYPLYNLALAYMELGRYDDAIASYRKAMLVAPRYSYLPHNLGLIYQKLNRADEAKAMFREALDRAEESRKRFNPALVEWPERAPILNALGTLARGRNTAMAFYDRALKDDPRSAASRHNKALLLAKDCRNLNDTRRLWNEATALEPRNITLWLSLGENLGRCGDWTHARNAYEEVVRLKPDYTSARRSLAPILVRLGDSKAALAHLDHAASLGARRDVAEERADVERILQNLRPRLSVYREAIRVREVVKK